MTLILRDIAFWAWGRGIASLGVGGALPKIENQFRYSPNQPCIQYRHFKDFGLKIWGQKTPSGHKINVFPSRAICHTVTIAKN